MVSAQGKPQRRPGSFTVLVIPVARTITDPGNITQSVNILTPGQSGHAHNVTAFVNSAAFGGTVFNVTQ